MLRGTLYQSFQPQWRVVRCLYGWYGKCGILERSRFSGVQKVCDLYSMSIRDVLTHNKHPGVSVTALDFLTTDQSIPSPKGFCDQWFGDLNRLTKARNMRPMISVTDQCIALLTTMNNTWNCCNLHFNLLDCWKIIKGEMSEEEIRSRTCKSLFLPCSFLFLFTITIGQV